MFQIGAMESGVLIVLLLLAASSCEVFGLSLSSSRMLKSKPQFNEESRFFSQRLDHFTAEDNRVFPQQYFETLDSFKAPDGPIILVVGGESATFGAYGKFTYELAKELGAAVVTLEHRYYGRSSPFKQLTVENLKYLTSKQAVFDLAVFRNYYQELISKKYQRSNKDNAWFVLGASYAGALSAWFRLKFPHLVSGSLASSGVVDAILSYSAYDEQVGISAGPACKSVLQQVTMLAEKGLEVNASAVKTQVPSAEHMHDEDFLYLIADAAASAIQYGDPGLVCDTLLKAQKTGENLLRAYMEVVKTFVDSYGITVQQYNADFLRKRTKAGSSGVTSSRNWWYQCCTEFGFFQVAPANDSIRSSRLNTEYHYNFCAKLFGNSTYPDVETTNLYYGGRNIAGSKILFMNGSQDPWRHASRQTSTADEPSFLVICDTCAHAVDLDGCSISQGNETLCTSELQRAHSLITSYAKSWLSATV